MLLVGEALTDEQAQLSKEKRADILIADRDNTLRRNSKKLKDMVDRGEIIPVAEITRLFGVRQELYSNGNAREDYRFGEGYSKGNLYRLVHMGDVESVRMCQRCGSLDVNVRQVGYFKEWESAEAICMDCGWDATGSPIHISDARMVDDYHVFLSTMHDKDKPTYNRG